MAPIILRKYAFTLAELLMAVLVISIIMVALAPVITRRAYDNISIEVNKKKGLEIFTNPGSYTFDVPVGINTLYLQGSGGGGGGGGAAYIDKSTSFTSSTTWTVPKNVSQVTFTITGSGGGGGAANGIANNNHPDTNPKVYNNSCTSDEFLATRGGYDELDLCYTRNNMGSSPMPDSQTCPGDNCCWKIPTDGNCSGSGCGRIVCTYQAGENFCRYYRAYSSGPYTYGADTYRLPKGSEWDKVKKYLDTWQRNISYDSGLRLCTHNAFDPANYESSNIAKCAGTGGCGGLNCGGSNHWVALENSTFKRWAYDNKAAQYLAPETSGMRALTVRCIRPLSRFNRYSGAGGASGAQLTKTVYVLPNDTFQITIGSGGSGGSSAGAKGNQGTNTQIIHKRGGIELGTYYVKGGLGGNGATTGAHGSAYTNGTASNQSTPNGTCYSKSRENTTGSFTTVNNCSVNSYSGNAGTASSGGGGGRVKDTGTQTSGGTLYVDSTRGANVRNTQIEADKAKGQNATVLGFGAGGGLTPGWATSSSHFFGGGKGANGKVDISYRIMLPGSGGGSATRVGGSKLISGANTMYEIKYKVEEGSRVVFKIGSGGSGGSIGQDGSKGSATVIGDNDIVFLAGNMGRAYSQSQKDSISSCIGSSTSTTTIANCLNNSSRKPQGGEASYINQNNEAYTNALGLIIKSQSNVRYTITSNFKGQPGKTPSSISTTTAPWSYGFDGGIGGAPFGISSNSIKQAVTCGGGISAAYGIETDSSSYLCTSGSQNANSARVHDPINNEFGSSGGGGGGVINNSLTLGEGGSGSSGYLRIRWDESENEEW